MIVDQVISIDELRRTCEHRAHNMSLEALRAFAADTLFEGACRHGFAILHYENGGQAFHDCTHSERHAGELVRDYGSGYKAVRVKRR
ncbi:MAG: hypothetical protein AB7U75_14795 [Hyphomicrobiaceae bacterium]